MPTQGVLDYKKVPHRRNDSDELDVFPAARYYNDNFALTQKVIKEEKQGYNLRGGRASLDIATLKHLHQYNHHTIAQPYPQKQQQEEQIKDKKYKQPSSPGGKLAHFLNTLFNQTSSKKKKPSSKSFSTQSMRDEDERRKRRSSISHFRSTNSVIDAKSIYSSSSSEFRTPTCNNINTTIKCYQDLKSLSDHKQVLANLSNYNIKTENEVSSNKPRIIGGRGSQNERSQKGSNLDWVDEKFEFRNGFVEKTKKIETIKSFKEEDLDDGGESDSSSDLFELQIDHELGFSSTGLPVYETTRMDSINRSPSTAMLPSKNRHP